MAELVHAMQLIERGVEERRVVELATTADKETLK
jgi:hypothetical protein